MPGSEEDYFEAQFELALQEIDPTSTPGYCALSKYGTDNRTALGMGEAIGGGKTFDPDRLEILRFLVKQRWREGGSDPLKIFIKQEPHKLAKLEEGRYRLISAVSLVDTMVDRILFGPMWRKALKRVLMTPCAVGWTPMKGGWRIMHQRYPEGTISMDKSAWDWTVQGWMIRIWFSFLLDMHPGYPDWWVKRVECRFYDLFYVARFRFPDGVEVCQQARGIMKSGCYLTLCLNSVAQTALHYLAAEQVGMDPYDNVPLSFGDDIVMGPFDEVGRYVEELEKYCLVKSVEYAPFTQFIGFILTSKGFVPEYWEKHLFLMAHLDDRVAEETLQSYQELYAYDPVMLRFIRDYAHAVCPSAIRSDSELRFVVDL